MLEHDILFNAVENLKKWIQLPINVRESNDKKTDVILEIGNANRYSVEIKRDIHKSNLPNVLNHLSQLFIGFPLLVAKSISKSAKEILKKKNINYLDMAGNCFIKNDGKLYIEIEGKKIGEVEKRRKHIAFNKNGIKLIYALLLDESLVNESYSVMATVANISKSTVGGILKDLKEKKFITQVSDKVRKINNKKGLQERWVQSYNEKLKPTLQRGRFRFLPNKFSKWKKINLGENTFWGGEPAADLVTNYLSPEEWTIYSNRSKNELLKKIYLVPDPKEGNVTVYNIFWNTKESYFVDKGMQIVNPLLVYADLIGTNDNRNFETAMKIYEKKLSTHFPK